MLRCSSVAKHCADSTLRFFATLFDEQSGLAATVLAQAELPALPRLIPPHYAAHMRICCVCTGNTCRSPMLERLLRAAIADEAVEVLSAGIAAAPGMPASDHSVACMADRGIDLSDHRSTPIQSLDLQSIDRFYCMGDRHAAALEAYGVPRDRIEVANAARGGVPDPFGMSHDIYEATATVLSEVAQVIAADLASRG